MGAASPMMPCSRLSRVGVVYMIVLCQFSYLSLRLYLDISFMYLVFCYQLVMIRLARLRYGYWLLCPPYALGYFIR